MSGEVRKKFQMTNFTMPNNSCSMKYALKSVPGLADVGVPHGDGDGPRTPPRCLEGSEFFSDPSKYLGGALGPIPLEDPNISKARD